MNRQLYQLGGLIEQAESFYTNNLGMAPQEARTVLSNALTPGSNLYVLPEKSDDYLYPQKKMDVNKFNPLNEYYENGINSNRSY